MRPSLLVLSLALSACSSPSVLDGPVPIDADQNARLLVVLDLGNTVEARASAFAERVQAELDAREADAQVLLMRTGFGDERLVAAISEFQPTHTVLVTATEATRIANVPGLNTNRPGGLASADRVPARMVVLDREGVARRDAQIQVLLGRQDNGARLLLRDIRRIGIATEADA